MARKEEGGGGFWAFLGTVACFKAGVVAVKGLAIGDGVGMANDAARVLRHTDDAIPTVARAARPMDDLAFSLSDDAVLALSDESVMAFGASDDLHPGIRYSGRNGVVGDANRIRKIGDDGIAYEDLPLIDKIAVQELRPARFQHFASVPADAVEAEAVFGPAFDARAMSGLHRTRARMELVERMTLATRDAGAEDLFRFVDDADTDFVTFIGHNDDGHLRLPSGHSVDMVELSAHCADRGKACVFLSCDSAPVVRDHTGVVGTMGELTFDDAMAAMRELEQVMAQQAMDQVSVHTMAGLLSEAVQRGVSQSQRRARVRYLGKRIGTGTGIGGVSIGVSELSQGNDDRKAEVK